MKVECYWLSNIEYISFFSFYGKATKNEAITFNRLHFIQRFTFYLLKRMELNVDIDQALKMNKSLNLEKKGNKQTSKFARKKHFRLLY